jgi:hypothetical protein
MRKLTIAVFMLVASVATTAPGEQGGTKKIVPLIDGMTITTSNTVDTVEVRAKSQGPGGCAVEFLAGRDHVGFVAPPFSYSPWTILFSHIGRLTKTLTEDVKCDTGVLSQVRY